METNVIQIQSILPECSSRSCVPVRSGGESVLTRSRSLAYLSGFVGRFLFPVARPFRFVCSCQMTFTFQCLFADYYSMFTLTRPDISTTIFNNFYHFEHFQWSEQPPPSLFPFTLLLILFAICHLPFATFIAFWPLLFAYYILVILNVSLILNQICDYKQ